MHDHNYYLDIMMGCSNNSGTYSRTIMYSSYLCLTIRYILKITDCWSAQKKRYQSFRALQWYVVAFMCHLWSQTQRLGLKMYTFKHSKVTYFRLEQFMCICWVSHASLMQHVVLSKYLMQCFLPLCFKTLSQNTTKKHAEVTFYTLITQNSRQQNIQKGSKLVHEIFEK